MSKRRKSNHNKVVNAVLAAALAFTAVVSTAQLASVSDDLSANVNGRYIAAHNPDCASQGMRYDSATDSCMAGDTGGGGGGGGTDTITCNALANSVVSRATCDAADTAKNACLATTPPGTWNGTGSGSCTAGGGGGGTCAAGSPVGNCTTQTACQSANFYWYNNVCNTTDTGGGGGGTCAAGSPVGNCTTQTACQSAGYFWYNNVCNTTDTAGGGGGTCVSGGTASACTSDAACRTANFYWYNNVCNTTDTAGGGGGTCTSGGTASACTSDAACRTANFYWYNNVCNTTDTAGGGQACSGGTPITCSDGSCAGTQLECSNRVGCLDGQVRDATGQCVSADANVDTNRTYDPAYYGRNRDSAGCIAAGYRWDSGRNDCFPGDLSSVLNTGTWYCGSIGKTFPNGEGGPECNCGDRPGGIWSNGTCTSASGEVIDMTKTFVFDPFAGDVPQCGPGQYFDSTIRACKAAQFNKDAVFSEDLYSTFTCPQWEPRCQEYQESDKLFEKPWEQAGCLSAGETRSASTQLESQLAELQQKFDSTSIANGTDSYAIASANAQLSAAQGLDPSDPCQGGQLKALLEGFDHEGFGIAQMIADFRSELERIQLEIDLERTRTTNTIAIGYYDAAEAATAELYANPPIDEAEPWKLWDFLVPLCMKPRFEILSGTGGGGNRNFGGPMCTIEEAIVGDTPRGLFMAGMMVANQGMRDEFGGDMCVNAAKHIAIFESKVIPQLSGTAKTTAKELAAKGKALAVACESAPVNERFTYMQKFEVIGREAEALMIEAGIDFEEFGFEQFDMGGVNQWSGGSDLVDMINQLIADAVKTATGEMLAQFAAKGVPSGVLEEIAIAMNSFSGSLAKKVQEGLGGTLETFSYLPEESMEAGSEVMEVTSDILQTLNVIKETAPDSEDDVEDLVEEIVEEIVEISPLPLEVLDVVEEEIKVLAVIAENGGVLTPKLEAVQEVLGDLNLAELNDQRIEEGTWFWADVSYEDKMWEGEANQYLIRAKSELNFSGTKNEDGKYDLAPSKILNVAEGLTMMCKTLGCVGDATVSADVSALVGPVEWAGPYVQELVDKVGIVEIKKVVTEAGGVGGAMDRDAFAGMTKKLADNAGVDVSADPGSEIGHYDDFDKMNTEQQSAFAFAHKIGMITGAKGGQEANFEGEANRMEATKMLTVFKATIQESEATGTESVAEINTSFLQTFGIEDVEDLVNLEVESLNGGEVNTGDPGSGITE